MVITIILFLLRLIPIILKYFKSNSFISDYLISAQYKEFFLWVKLISITILKETAL